MAKRRPWPLANRGGCLTEVYFTLLFYNYYFGTLITGWLEGSCFIYRWLLKGSSTVIKNKILSYL